MNKNFQRYKSICDWAARRYNSAGPFRHDLLLDRGGVASRYSVIEVLASEKLLGLKHARSKRLSYPSLWEAPAK